MPLGGVGRSGESGARGESGSWENVDIGRSGDQHDPYIPRVPREDGDCGCSSNGSCCKETHLETDTAILIPGRAMIEFPTYRDGKEGKKEMGISGYLRGYFNENPQNGL